MNKPSTTYTLPNDLHEILANERISVSPTGEQPGNGADFYAFVFDVGQEDAVNAFGATPSEAVAKVLEQLGKPVLHQVSNAEGECDAACAAIAFALSDSEGMQFLHCWNEGDFDSIRKEWPDAPEAVFIGADPLYKPA